MKENSLHDRNWEHGKNIFPIKTSDGETEDFWTTEAVVFGTIWYTWHFAESWRNDASFGERCDFRMAKRDLEPSCHHISASKDQLGLSRLLQP